MKERRGSIGVILFLLNFCIFLVITLGGMVVYLSLVKPNDVRTKILELILNLIVFWCVGNICYSLKKIIKNIKVKNIFIVENAKRFKIIGSYVIIFGIIYSMLFSANKGGISIIKIGDTGFGPETFLYLILGGLAFILAYIFEEAIKLKEEQDLTI
ncbi:DUF2975 domain-containing protein [Desnuesiella massiliensis]|uniref:DUF2975 domain-containing protein n=1 Tax=Desnuesiella massiliensis TaxID=1650662 RepID=UPI0006E1B4C3|nr:DUF2975 domain-containing protein [Desnuesiella massiliensis]